MWLEREWAVVAFLIVTEGFIRARDIAIVADDRNVHLMNPRAAAEVRRLYKASLIIKASCLICLVSGRVLWPSQKWMILTASILMDSPALWKTEASIKGNRGGGGGGGIALLVRNRILNMVKIVEHVDFQRQIEKSLHKFYHFVDFCVFNDGKKFQMPCDTQNDTNCKKLLVCAWYIPPEGSVYSNRSSFTELEETLLHINLDNVLIIGNLNARTGDSSDYIWDTAALDNVLDDVGPTELMKMYNIQQDRGSQDVGKNNFGHVLIDFCISQRLLIVNSRVGRDALLTVIASPCVFPCICDFYVGDFDECLSYIHCPVFIKLKTGTDSPETIHNVNVSQCMMGFAKPVWRPGAERDYLAQTDEGGVEVIYDRMQKLLESTDSINQSDIDDITDGICSLLTNAAVKLNMYKSQACMREDKGQKNQNEPRRQEIKQINTLGLTQNARRKGPSIEKLKVCIKVMLIIIPKEREHVGIKSIKKF